MKRLALIIAILSILGYGAFEARRIIAGPQITILSPRDGSATSTNAIRVEGIAENISFLTINDNPAYTDESGHFSQVLSPPEGYAIFTVAATDRFGRRAHASVRISVLNFCPVHQS